jgi:hypothetical protein
MLYIVMFLAICLPPILGAFLFRFSRRYLRYRSIRSYFRKRKAEQIREDRIYFEIFQKGYKKEDVEKALKEVKIIDKEGPERS